MASRAVIGFNGARGRARARESPEPYLVRGLLNEGGDILWELLEIAVSLGSRLGRDSERVRGSSEIKHK